MEPLLQYHNTPAKISIQVNRGNLRYSPGSIQMHISREKGGLSMKRKAPKLKLDSFEARNSVCPTAFNSIKDYAQRGKQAALEATSNYVSQGKRAMEVPLGEEVITQFSKELMFKNVKTNVGLDFIPKGGVKISYEPGYQSIQYTADRLRISWQLEQPKFQFNYGNTDISLAQRPHLDLEYVGRPTYVPKSSGDSMNFLV